MKNLYLRAWKLLRQRINRKASWGKEEIKKLMLDCLIDAEEQEEGKK